MNLTKNLNTLMHHTSPKTEDIFNLAADLRMHAMVEGKMLLVSVPAGESLIIIQKMIHTNYYTVRTASEQCYGADENKFFISTHDLLSKIESEILMPVPQQPA